MNKEGGHAAQNTRDDAEQGKNSHVHSLRHSGIGLTEAGGAREQLWGATGKRDEHDKKSFCTFAHK